MTRGAIASNALGICTVAVVAFLGSVTATLGAESRCRVRNVTQDVSGRSLIRMVERAVDGDHLRVGGTCLGGITIGADIRIVGVGQHPTLTGPGGTMVVSVRDGATVELRGLTIEQPGTFRRAVRNGGALTLADVVVRRTPGGGIVNAGTAVLIDSIVRRNGRSGIEDGGGILNFGNLTLIRSTVSGNAARYAGGIFSDGGVLTLDRSRVRGNASRFWGGGIGNHAVVVMTDSRVVANTTRGKGGGIWNNAYDTSVTLTRSIVTGNVARHGGGIYNRVETDDAGQVTLDADSTVSDNTPDDCVGTHAC